MALTSDPFDEACRARIVEELVREVHRWDPLSTDLNPHANLLAILSGCLADARLSAAITEAVRRWHIHTIDRPP